MKKVMALVLVLLLSLSFLGGCTTQKAKADSAEETGGTQLTLWYWNRSLDDGLLEQVATQFPGTTIKAEKISDIKTKIITTMAAGSGLPDILMINDWLPDLMTNAEQFVNLKEAPYNAEELAEDYYDWKWDMCYTADKSRLVALPVDTGPCALFYRADLFEQAGLPSEPEEVAAQMNTWPALLDAGETLVANTDAKMFENLQRIFIYALSQNDQQYMNRENEFIGDQEHVRKCFDLALDVHQRQLSYNVDNWTPEWNAAINNGDIACFPGAFWMKKVLQDAGPDTAGKWRITSLPESPGNNGGSFIAIPSSSAHPEQAYEVVKWLISPENQAHQLNSISLFPSSPKAFELDVDLTPAEDFFGGQQTNALFAEAAKDIPTAYIGPNSSAFQDIFQEQLKMVAEQGKDPEQAWQDATEKCKSELTR